MHGRAITGLVLLLGSASCVAPELAAQDAVRPHVAAVTIPIPVRHPDRIMPAGPAPMFLEPAPTLAPAAVESAIAEPPPFAANADPADAARALDCLTAAVYYEARSEPIDGQRAVAQVVLNRVRNPAFPNSVCGVVYEGANRTTGCQFTFTCDGSMALRREPEAWERAREVAAAALAGSVYAPVGAATYYHTTAVSPWWAASLTRVAQIGAHIFYRWGTGWGDALNFRQRYGGVEPEVGTAIADKAPDQILRDIGTVLVRVHRGDEVTSVDAGQPQPFFRETTSFGVTVHRTGSAPAADDLAASFASAPSAPTSPAPSAGTAAIASVGGVHIHRGEGAAQPDQSPAPSTPGA